MRLSLAISTPGHFGVAFHAGEDLHFVGVVAGLGGTTEQVHLCAARWAWGPIFDAKRARLHQAGRAFAMDGAQIPSFRIATPPEILHRNQTEAVQNCSRANDPIPAIPLSGQEKLPGRQTFRN